MTMKRVEVDRDQDDLAPRERLRDPRRIRAIVVEVEVHQGLIDYNSSLFAARTMAWIGKWFGAT